MGGNKCLFLSYFSLLYPVLQKQTLAKLSPCETLLFVRLLEMPFIVDLKFLSFVRKEEVNGTSLPSPPSVRVIDS
jgi:hypothetical protein